MHKKRNALNDHQDLWSTIKRENDSSRVMQE